MGLERFREAQERHWEAIVGELRAGRKRTHWMWYVFPQLRGLGRSATAEFYGIDGRAEAEAYLADPVLGSRLREVMGLMLDTGESDAARVLGGVDALKLRSSATLFDVLAPEEVFGGVLARFYGGERDPATVEMLRADG